MKRFWFEDEGAVAVIVALSIFLLVAFTAVAVDVGYMYSEKRQLQTAADAGALAGCRVLADGGSNAAIDAEARAYATINSVAPGDDLYVEDVEIGADYVQVTVGKDSPLFFAAVFGTDSSLIRANARANVAYLTGMRGIVPLSVPVIAEPTKVTATINGVEHTLTHQGGGTWSKTIPAPGAASATGYQMDVSVYNSQRQYPDGTPNGFPDGVPETLIDAARVFIKPADCPITDVALDEYVLTGGGENVHVTVLSPNAKDAQVRLDGSGKWIKLKLTSDAATGRFEGNVAIPTSDDLQTTHYLNVESTGADKKAYTVNKAVSIVVRRSTFPILDVSLADYSVGPGGALNVTVEVNDYVFEKEYSVHVAGGGGEVGNFMAIDLSKVYHTPNWKNPDPVEYDVKDDPDYKPPAYKHYLAEPYPFTVHIGDTIWTEPGAEANPTMTNLNLRFAGDNRTYEQWKASGDVSSNRIVYLPVVEKMDKFGGTSPVRVVSFAAFYVQPSSGNKANQVELKGVFLEYVAPSDAISETPPDGLYTKTVHLVAPE